MCHRLSFLSLLFLSVLINFVHAGLLDNIEDALKDQTGSKKLYDALEENIKQIVTNITSKVIDAAQTAVKNIQDDALKAVNQIQSASNSTVEQLRDELKASMIELIENAETAVANNKEVKWALKKFDIFLILEIVFMIIVILYIFVQFSMMCKRTRCCGLCGKSTDHRYSEDDIFKGKSLEQEYLRQKRGDVYL